MLFQLVKVFRLFVLNPTTDKYESRGFLLSKEAVREAVASEKNKHKLEELDAFVSDDGKTHFLAGVQIQVSTNLQELRKQQALAKLSLEDRQALGLTD